MATCSTKCMCYLLHRVNNLVITLLILTSDSQLNMSTTQQVNNLIERESSMAIINASKWPSTQPITNLTKHSLLQKLVVEEVIKKRDDHILSLRKGLEVLGFVAVMQRFPKQCEQLFVYGERLLTAAKLRGLIGTPRPQGSKQRQAYDFFSSYIDDREYTYGKCLHTCNYIVGST